MIIYANLERRFTQKLYVMFQVNDLMQDYHLYTTSVTKVRTRKKRGQELSCSTAFVSVAIQYLCVSAKQPRSSIVLQEVALAIRLFCRPSDIGKDLCFSSSRKEIDTIHWPT